MIKLNIIIIFVYLHLSDYMNLYAKLNYHKQKKIEIPIFCTFIYFFQKFATIIMSEHERMEYSDNNF